jgi:outer membrane protein OmpA-like peptidoglycan-associated protein
MRQSPALSDLDQARQAIVKAKLDGKLSAEKIAELEKRHLQARGVYYACNDAEASRLAKSIIADAQPPMVAAPPPPPANQPPRARIKGPDEVEVNTLVAVTGEDSSDPDGDKLNYKWDFGDGTTASFTFPNATHRYTKAGSYAVRLTVDDGRGGSDTATKTVSVIRRVVLQEKEGKVLFDFDKATLKPVAQQELAGVVQEMQENPRLRAELVGHTDSVGTDAYNMGLSQRRTESVGAFMVSKGISRDRLKLEWKGESEPIAPNTTKEGRALNRRVEITVRPMQ